MDTLITKAQIDSSPIAPAIHLDLLGFLSLGEPILNERRWGLWRFEESLDRNGKTKWAKVPWTRCYTDSGRLMFKRTGSNGKRSHEWLTFREAAAVIALLKDAGKPCDFGIAFMLGQDDRYVVIDLDNHRDLLTGQLTPEAAAIVASSPTTAWVSNSQTGIHIIGLGKKPGRQCMEAEHNSSKPGYEIYSGSHFMALTGIQVVADKPIADCTDLVSHVYFTHISPGDTPESLAQRDAAREAERTEVAKRLAEFRGQDTNRVARARAYLAKVPPAISGQGGHNATFEAACILVGFDLDYAEALALLSEWNMACEPEWTHAELKHKLDGAYERATRGTMLLGSRNRDDDYTLSPAAEAMLFGKYRKDSKVATIQLETAKVPAHFPEDARSYKTEPFDARNVLGDQTKPTAEIQAEHAEREAARAAARAFKASCRNIEDPIMNQDDGFGKLCPCFKGYAHTMLRKRDASISYFRHRCKSWKHDACFVMLCRLNAPHFAAMLTRIPQVVGGVVLATERKTPIYKLEINPTDNRIEALLTEARRRGGHAVVVKRDYWSETSTALSDVPLAGSSPIKPAEAAAIVRADIYAIRPESWGLRKCRPIHCSRGWSLPEPDHDDEYVDLGPIKNAETAKVVAAIRDEGFEPQTFYAPSKNIDPGVSFKTDPPAEVVNDKERGIGRLVEWAQAIVGRIGLRLDDIDPDDHSTDFLWSPRNGKASQIATFGAGSGPLQQPLLIE